MNTQPKSNTSLAGFTLIETLAAMALMGLVVAALVTITAQWLPNWNRGLIRIQSDDILALGLERIAADIEAAEFLSAGHESERPYFSGTPRSITFVRTILAPSAGPGLEIIRIAEVSGERGPVLVRTRAPLTPVGADTNNSVPLKFSDPVVLLRAPYRVLFSYAGADRIWRETWQQQIQLPNAVKLTLRDTVTQRTVSTSSAVAIHVDAPAQCIVVKSFDDCLKRLQSSKSNPDEKSRL